MKARYSFNPDASWPQAELGQLDAALQFISEQRQQCQAQLELATELASILDHLHVDHELIIAGVLLEGLDHEAAFGSAVAQRFGDDIAQVFEETCHFLGDEISWLKEDRVDDGHQMLLLSMLKDVRVVFLLLAHQLLSMRHLKHCDEQQQRVASIKTRYVFAPLANRLGIGQVKWELEDLAFRYLEPQFYKQIARALEERRVDRERYIKQVVGELSYALQTAGIQAQVYGRPKHIFSIWKKMQNKQLAFEDLYDVRALRVMVDDITQCYAALSVVHSVWPFVPGEYDDYIAAPKGNGYQSLHTAVHGPEGKTVEIQIRTREMHAHAELGVAAHWRYKEGGKRDQVLEKRIDSLRAILANDKPAADSIVEDKDESHIYVLTPKGNVIEMAANATPLDFAYHIHTDVGHRCRGAKVDGKMVPLTSSLKSGQQVEIITAKQGEPSRDWLIPHLGYLKTNRARSKVRHWFKQQFRDQHIHSGRAALLRELTREQMNAANWKPVCERFNLHTADDLFAAIGRGEIGALQVVHLLEEFNPPAEAEQALPEKRPSQTVAPAEAKGVTIEGVGDLLTTMARCCKPMPGDDIIGFITRGRGVTVHRRDCANVTDLLRRHQDRLIAVSWGGQEGGRYDVDVELEALDRAGLLRDITSVLAGEEVNVTGANTHTNKHSQLAKMRLTLQINHSEQLKHALARLSQVQGVLDAHRVK